MAPTKTIFCRKSGEELRLWECKRSEPGALRSWEGLLNMRVHWPTGPGATRQAASGPGARQGTRLQSRTTKACGLWLARRAVLSACAASTEQTTEREQSLRFAESSHRSNPSKEALGEAATCASHSHGVRNWNRTQRWPQRQAMWVPLTLGDLGHILRRS